VNKKVAAKLPTDNLPIVYPIKLFFAYFLHPQNPSGGLKKILSAKILSANFLSANFCGQKVFRKFCIKKIKKYTPYLFQKMCACHLNPTLIEGESVTDK